MNLTDLNAVSVILLVMLLSLIASAVLTVLTRNLLKAAIALGLTSAILTIIMFIMGSYLAAVFELSVCAGLITVIFISTISLLKPQTREEAIVLAKKRLKRYIYLPVLLIAVAAVLFVLKPYFNVDWVARPDNTGLIVQNIMWGPRQLDLLGQVIIILAGVFGVVILFKERGAK